MNKAKWPCFFIYSASWPRLLLSSALFYHFNICMILHSLLFQEFICSLKLLVTSDSLPQTLAANAKQKLNALYSCDKEQQKYLEIVSQISQWFFGLCDTIIRRVFIAKIVLYHYYIIKYSSANFMMRLALLKLFFKQTLYAY